MIRRLLSAGARLLRQGAGALDLARDLLGGGEDLEPSEDVPVVAEPARMTTMARQMLAAEGPNEARAGAPEPLQGSVEARRRKV